MSLVGAGRAATSVAGLYREFRALEAASAKFRASDAAPAAPGAPAAGESEAVFSSFIRTTLLDYPGYMGGERMWELYEGRATGKTGATRDKAEFLRIFRDERAKFGKLREREKTALRRKREVRRQHKTLTGGYSEASAAAGATSDAASAGAREAAETRTLREDVAKARYYAGLCADLRERFPTSTAGAGGGGAEESVRESVRGALRRQVRAELRPVLTHELGDFENAYVMVRATRERLLVARGARSKFEEALVEQLVEEDAEMARMRSAVDEPPAEVLEPLMAFRGTTSFWASDASGRLGLKLAQVERVLDSILGGAAVEAAGSRLQGWRWNHPFKNHTVLAPDGKEERLGGWNFGRPESEERAELRRMRYPTLQRVRHSASDDPTYRSLTLHAIDVLERSKGWGFQDKLRAVNTLKEALDNLPTATYYRRKLDKALPLIRARTRTARSRTGRTGLAGTASLKLYKTFPRNWRTRSRLGIYHKSFTASKSLASRQSERRQKDADRKKKEDREKKLAQATKKPKK